MNKMLLGLGLAAGLLSSSPAIVVADNPIQQELKEEFKGEYRRMLVAYGDYGGDHHINFSDEDRFEREFISCFDLVVMGRRNYCQNNPYYDQFTGQEVPYETLIEMLHDFPSCREEE